ncbi:MAG: adenosine deaminase [Rhodobacter sp.]|nr:adenosine deaminase [Rhodobacter sp.]
MSVADLPKVELHLHLEGAAPPGFIRGLAAEKDMDISHIFDPDGGYAYRDFRHFLEVYEAATATLQSPEDYHRLTLAVLEQSAANGVVYCETFLSPDFCGNREVSAWKDYLQAIREAAEIAEARDGIVLRGIVTCIRHFGPEKAKQTARCAAETAGDWLVGFGMAGDESRGKPGDFCYAFDVAREAGLGITVHAGEWGGAASVRDAMVALRPSRIGHGVQAIEEPAVVARLADEQVVLEVCPGSNVFLGVFPSWQDHPIQRLRDAGVPVTVSTDDPPFFHTALAAEYDRLAETFGWEAKDFRDINLTAARAAFCDEATRARVIETLEAAYA